MKVIPGMLNCILIETAYGHLFSILDAGDNGLIISSTSKKSFNVGVGTDGVNYVHVGSAETVTLDRKK